MKKDPNSQTKTFLRHNIVRLSIHRYCGGCLPTIHSYVSMGRPFASSMSPICYGIGAYTLIWLDFTYSWWESHFSSADLGLLFCDKICGVISSMGDHCSGNVGGVGDIQMFPIWFFSEPMLEDACRRMK